ncbi:MAG: TonB family protein [Prevotella sp.]|nr:TonB family protein [Prevotella sp.]
MPQFPGGQAALMEYLTKNVKYPEEAHKKGVQGRVIASFVVEEDGSITNANIAKSVDPLLDAEALRVVNAMPNWTPGMQSGKAVRVKYTLPFTFKLDGKKTVKARTYVLEVDGKIVDNSELDNIPPENIERIDILKDVEGQPDKIRVTTKKKE